MKRMVVFALVLNAKLPGELADPRRKSGISADLIEPRDTPDYGAAHETRPPIPVGLLSVPLCNWGRQEAAEYCSDPG